MSVESFSVLSPSFDATTGLVRFPYRLGGLPFTETLGFPEGFDASVAGTASFQKLLELTAVVLGVSYYKLLAPLTVDCGAIALTADEAALALDIYTNGLGEFYARNGLAQMDRVQIRAAPDTGPRPAAPLLAARALLPIGGGKDSLVSVQLLEHAGIDFTPFAVNAKGPILSSVETIGRAPLYVTRALDKEMIRLAKMPGYLNGHVPSTAINSMIAALTALLFGYDRILLSNERSASEGNAVFDGREVNHQHSKSLDFEAMIAGVLAGATGGALGYFSLLRPFSEAHIAALFAREDRFDAVFSSCNQNFRIAGHDGPLWCGKCPKCHFVFLILAPAMSRARLSGIFGADLLDKRENLASFRTLTGLAGQKPWECVGEILEAAACLHQLSKIPDWSDHEIVRVLGPELLAQYGEARLESAYSELMKPDARHLLPPDLAGRILADAS
ncbi:hypothetical protein SAMN02983003_1481 [Devosia enhydra]|uniref:UDP-N-acetyl-alpha-D-muramoyl-L-alanyl-L-glutamate epimerase n=1 Tax=Devosia enhydra TaxID=665118 RepID=A0A1K2HW44_9HYPH|nr:hypothetical protein [Devosia enhydra]SFZ83142.1 hypothetical protein SAMN02983003_1481 [Devosia enhydra]